MAVSIVNVTSNDSGGVSTASLTVTTPASIVAGDVLIAAIGHRGGSSTLTPPSGWSEILNSGTNTAPSIRTRVYSRVVTGSEAADYAWGISTNNAMWGMIVALRGVNTTDVMDAGNGQTATLTMSATAPTITTDVAGDLLIYLGASTGSAAPTTPTGMTSRATGASTSLSYRVATETQTAAGATGTRTGTVNASTVVAQLIAITNAGITLSGVTTGSSSDAALISLARPLVAVSAGASTAAATPVVAQSLSSTPTGATQTAVGVAVARGLSSTANGISTTSAAAVVAKALSTTSTAASTATAAGAIAKVLAAASAGVSTTVMSLTVEGESEVALAAVSAGVNTTSAALATTRPLRMTSAGQGATTGAVSVARGISSSSAGASAESGTVTIARGLRGLATGQSQGGVAAVVARRLLSTIAGQSAAAATLRREGEEEARAIGAVAGTGRVGTVRSRAGSGTAMSTATAGSVS